MLLTFWQDSWLNVVFLGSSLGSFVANWTCMVFKTKTNKIFSAATGNLQLLELTMHYHPCFLHGLRWNWFRFLWLWLIMWTMILMSWATATHCFHTLLLYLVEDCSHQTFYCAMWCLVCGDLVCLTIKRLSNPSLVLNFHSSTTWLGSLVSDLRLPPY